MRISPKLIRTCRQISPLLPPLLRANRTVEAAQQELKWIQQELPQNEWVSAVRRRFRLEPLQYILGTQPFGDLDISVRPNVLIPRWETEEWAMKLAAKLVDIAPSSLTILDICTGSGCIPLSLNHTLKKHNINNKIDAIDVSESAIDLSNHNKQIHHLNVNFSLNDIFKFTPSRHYDILTSNPPYIPINDYLSAEVEKSVRYFEPPIALVGDLEFYKRLTSLAEYADAFIFELGYQRQADYVRDTLDRSWQVGTYKDGAGNLRCVIGAKADKFDLMSLCNFVYKV